MKKIVGLFLAVLASCMFLLPGAASALASNCSTIKYTGSTPQSGSVRCFSGTGAYRVRVWCTFFDNGPGIIRSGPWVGIGSMSKATCTSSYPFVYKITVEKVG